MNKFFRFIGNVLNKSAKISVMVMVKAEVSF